MMTDDLMKNSLAGRKRRQLGDKQKHRVRGGRDEEERTRGKDK